MKTAPERRALRRIDSPPLDAGAQMALDETLFRSAADGEAWVRFYGWNGPAMTFGYAQRWGAVAPLVPGGDVARAARRPTGGGVVMHGDDLTFSASFPADGAWNPEALYEALHGQLRQTLAERGVEVRLCGDGEAAVPAPQSEAGPLQCFRSPVRMDLLAPNGGGKILGGALRKRGGRVLYQGSLRLPGGAVSDTAVMRDAITAGWLRFLGLETVREAPSPEPDVELVAKYRSAAWRERR